jgi:hypothetical protein
MNDTLLYFTLHFSNYYLKNLLYFVLEMGYNIIGNTIPTVDSGY